MDLDNEELKATRILNGADRTEEEKAITLLIEMQENCIKGMMKGAIYTDGKAEQKSMAIDTVIQALKDKDKIIDLMTDFIFENTTDCLLNILNIDKPCKNNQDCKTCIKEHFVNKAKDLIQKNYKQ